MSYKAAPPQTSPLSTQLPINRHRLSCYLKKKLLT